MTPDAPINESGLIQMIRMGKSIRHIWVNYFQNWMTLYYDHVNGRQAVIAHNRDENTGVRGNTTVLYDYKGVSSFKRHLYIK